MAVKLSDYFKKDISRRINGVISAGQSDYNELKIEFSEYVVTNDVGTSLETFFEYYNELNPQKNGVWLSGFFGSGKSHLLKILSYLLENRSVGEKSCLSYFEEKLSEDTLLLAAIKKGCQIPSESILFNIIQCNQVDKNGKAESILPIFLRQFYEHCGYYGSDFTIAEMERELDSEHLLQKFIEQFEALSGKSWIEARPKKNLNSKNIIKAFALVTGQDENPNLLQSYNVSKSIEDFASLVREYIDAKGPNFRLNFFVDEAGQFVIKSSRLMVELQEIATTLSDKCDNRSWVIVTSQDLLKAFMEKFDPKDAISGDDVSKIRDRFYINLKLTNQNVDEVIQKRLLAKNYEGTNFARSIYTAYKESFDTLFSFFNGPMTLKSYKDENSFINTYPFVTYQFDLFKMAFTNLSEHGAFPGEYTSTGARSLLDIFHRVLNKIATPNALEGNKYPIVPFDAFYDGIEDNLMENFKQSIFIAENNIGEDNPFAIRVLKTLLMIKYLQKGFKPSAKNIATLLLSNLTDNPDAILRQTEDALNLLDAQTYIQRTTVGDYEFLTNEEKDIETEIKNTEIPDPAIYEFLNKAIYKRILSNVNKAKDAAKNGFPICKQIDATTCSPSQQDLGLLIMTSYGNDFSQTPYLTVQQNKLVILLKDEGKLFNDIILSIKTERYLRNLATNNLSAEKRKITEEKRTFNNERNEEIEKELRKLLNNAEMYIAGEPLSIKPTNDKPDSRVELGLTTLVEKVYTNLPMLGEQLFTDETVSAAFDTEQTAELITTNTEAENQILAKIELEKKKGSNSTVKNLTESFATIPYGWPNQAVITLLVQLFKKGRIEIKQSGLELSEEKLRTIINATNQWSNLVVIAVDSIPSQKIKAVKGFYYDFTGTTCDVDTAKDVVTKLQEAFKEELAQINKFNDAAKYPFVAKMNEARELIEKTLGQSNSWYFKEFLNDTADTLLDEMENSVIPCLSFLQNYKALYDQSFDTLRKYQEELVETNKQLWEPIQRILDDPNIVTNHSVSQLTGLCNSLTRSIKNELVDHTTDCLEKIKDFESKQQAKVGYDKLSAEVKENVKAKFESWNETISKAETQKDVNAAMYSYQNDIDDYINAELSKLEVVVAEKETKKRSFNELGAIRLNSKGITSKEEVEEFIGQLKEEMLKAIEEGFVIGN